MIVRINVENIKTSKIELQIYSKQLQRHLIINIISFNIEWEYEQ